MPEPFIFDILSDCPWFHGLTNMATEFVVAMLVTALAVSPRYRIETVGACLSRDFTIAFRVIGA